MSKHRVVFYHLIAEKDENGWPMALVRCNCHESFQMRHRMARRYYLNEHSIDHLCPAKIHEGEDAKAP